MASSNSDSGDDQIDRKDFSLLPDEVFQTILGHLTLEDRIRCQRVNKKWRLHCDQSICSKPIQIDFTNTKMFAIPEDQLIQLLRKCANQLTATVFDRPRPIIADRVITADKIANLFSQFTYPKMERLQFDDGFADELTEPKTGRFHANVLTLINRCPSLKQLRTDGFDEEDVDLSTIIFISPDLQKLDLLVYEATMKSVMWMTKKCNNLTDLTCEFSVPKDEPAKSNYLEAMRGLFQARRQLTRFDISHFAGEPNSCQLMLKNVMSFWSLTKLIDLRLDKVDDQDLAQVVQSFPLLKTLRVYGCGGLTKIGVSSLAQLSELHDLVINGARNSISDGVFDIATNGKLMKFKAFGSNLGDLCWLIRIMQCCEHISKLQVPYLPNPPTVRMAILFIDNIKIFLRPGGQLALLFTDRFWNRPAIQKSVITLRDLGGGRSIKGEIGECTF